MHTVEYLGIYQFGVLLILYRTEDKAPKNKYQDMCLGSFRS